MDWQDVYCMQYATVSVHCLQYGIFSLYFVHIPVHARVPVPLHAPLRLRLYVL